MNITKKYLKTTTYEIIHAIANKPFSNFGEFMEDRKVHGLKTSRFEKCFSCDHAFANDEDVFIGTVSPKGNIFFCKECVDKYDTKEELPW